MADILKIAELADGVCAKHGTRDPFEIASEEGVRVCRYDLGTLAGMYVVIESTPFIAISEALESREAYTVCAHELGHHLLHFSLAKTSALADSSLFSGGGRLENEANIFACQLLVSDGEFCEAMDGKRELFAVASELSIPAELAALKCDILREKGYKINSVDFSADFMKNLIKNPLTEF